MAEYPKGRGGSFFALKFCKLLSKTAAANEIGADAVLLLMTVALKEDSKQYTDAPNYWNGQLMPLCGIGSPKRLVTARQKAIEAGWLHYQKGGKGKVARYWVKVPERFESIFGKRSESDLYFRNGSRTGNVNGTQANCTSVSESQSEPTRKRNRPSSIPEPIPKPKRKRFSYPKDFEQFWEAYPTGRKTGKKAALKAWEQATRDAEAETIIAAASEYAASDVGRSQYVKGPTSWLNQGCWDDDRSAWKNKQDDQTQNDTARRIT